MAGQFTLEAESAPLAYAMGQGGWVAGAVPAGDIRVYALSGTTYTLLPNVRLISTSRRLGADPGQASFYYAFGDIEAALLGWPSRFEQVWGVYAWHPMRMALQGRLVAFNHLPGGVDQLLFDGYVTAKSVSLDEDEEAVILQAAGAPVAEWDTAIPGALWRDAHDIGEVGGDIDDEAFKLTELPARFNPDGRPNRTPPWVDYCTAPDRAARDFPIAGFFDPEVRRTPSTRYHWTLADAVKYVLRAAGAQVVVRYDRIWPNLDAILSEPRPTSGAYYDPADPSTYELEPIRASDLDVTGMAWPEAVARLVEPHGYVLCFRWRLGAGNLPEWQLDIFKRNRPAPALPLRLQPAGSGRVDPALTNLAAANLTLDASEVVNSVTCDTRTNRYQVTLALAPLFEIDPADASESGLARFVEGSKTAQPGDEIKYRLFGLDETGDGHWVEGWITGEPPDLRPVLDIETALPGSTTAPKRGYATRYRPALRELLEAAEGLTGGDPLAEDGPRAEARLWVVKAADYRGPVPGLYDPQNDDEPAVARQLVADGQWELLEDRCGIRITCKDPNDWSIGDQEDEDDALPFPDGKVPIVECLATPDEAANHPEFLFLLDCVIEGDRGMATDAHAPWRPVSPVDWLIFRRDDSRDRFGRDLYSAHCQSRAGLELPEDEMTYTRDDGESAGAQSRARRGAQEVPKVAGTVTVFGICRSYRLGDRISGVAGRGASFRMDRGLYGSADARYPMVVGEDTSYEGRVETTLHLEDLRGEAEMDPMTRRRQRELSAMDRIFGRDRPQ